LAALAGSSEFAQPKSVAWNAVVRDGVWRGAGWWRCKASKTARLKPGGSVLLALRARAVRNRRRWGFG